VATEARAPVELQRRLASYRDRHRSRWDAPSLRVGRLVQFALAFIVIMALRAWLFPAGRPPVLWWEHALQLMSWFGWEPCPPRQWRCSH
jgi:hypothetical protein